MHDVVARARPPHRRPHGRAQVPGKLVHGVAGLVRLAALEPRASGPDLDDGLAQRLGAIADEPRRLLGRQPALPQVDEQLATRGRVLRGALADADTCYAPSLSMSTAMT